ncbi:WecB/TagA/CpsF family glycosyltransferase [Sciscionella sediminilitoris]|uniref:WecB/TagA/CpsF family glycosyltransferase n=1 Tax=Sciscionella sediminilitoris TaxID=1445613 RepID=UPI00055CEAE2|nr:WecB/TagA/CpsF family glycosyltransferase [Sciscionella sp. SE31]
MESITVLGVPVAAIGREQALARIAELIAEPEPALLAFANAHACNLAARDPGFRALLCHRAALVLPDGAGLAIAARLRGRSFPANLNGTDFLPVLLGQAAAHGHRVFLIGGHPGVAERAARCLRARGVPIAGTAHGYHADGARLAAEVAASGASILLVGMGMPRQEFWLDAHLGASGARLGIAVGAFLDFTAQRVPRAPGWMRRARMEWVYRLAREPRRMFGRYVLGNPAFLLRVVAGGHRGQ